ncbi:3-deoxy-manno-octulosonate cytidylyltransferase [Vulgatibacter incomptus]|uniref:3-deoxy-manno-octulosonate cytidylyltransferase n=1 Tax=Vulgatibacter incomptus TaxID=1391653 RepID=A0A0K1PFQ5_9BACT|nr:3-deoxy-manno-octulosonate cytidylyltransferase [Vulgatibacter incomptus]AKU92241.1 3-deoxy-manno-octulosonate cytidylyltransferase [Vulgatibacter incomptus]
MKTAIIVPARFASERLPGKPLADLGGKPMIVRVLERARAVRGIERAVVATDDERIAAAVRADGGEVAMTPSDCPSGSDRCAHAARQLGDLDVVVNVQGDEPLLEPRAVEALLGAFSDPTVEMATLARPLEPGELDNPNVVKVVCNLRGDALYFSRAPIPHLRGGGPGTLGRAHVGIYAFRASFLQAYTRLSPTPLEQSEKLEQLRVLEHSHAIRVVDTTWRSIGVDTPEDLERVRAYY